VAALREGVAAVRATGAEVVIAEMPCTEEFVLMYPRAYDDLAESRRLLRSLADDLGVEFLSAPDDLPQRWFADCVHLNGTGMREWSADVGALLAERLAA
jgi:lysophospholipase L1-like esterase